MHKQGIKSKKPEIPKDELLDNMDLLDLMSAESPKKQGKEQFVDIDELPEDQTISMTYSANRSEHLVPGAIHQLGQKNLKASR